MIRPIQWRLDGLIPTVMAPLRNEAPVRRFAAQPCLEDPFPPQTFPRLTGTIPDQTMHLIAGREPIWVAQLASYSVDALR